MDDDKQDDLTLVYMWAYKQAEKKYKGRIEELEATLHWIVDIEVDGTNAEDCVLFMKKEASAVLGKK
jgi:hypothetical protein